MKAFLSSIPLQNGSSQFLLDQPKVWKDVAVSAPEIASFAQAAVSMYPEREHHPFFAIELSFLSIQLDWFWEADRYTIPFVFEFFCYFPVF